MSTYDPTNWFPATPLTAELAEMFKDAAFDDGLVDGQNPIAFFQSLSDKSSEELKQIGIVGETLSPAYLATALGFAAEGTLAGAAGAFLGPLGIGFVIANVIDGGRSMTISVVNKLETALSVSAKSAYLYDGETSFGPAVYETDGTTIALKNTIPAKDGWANAGLPGPMLGLFKFQKSTVLGVGYYGSEGAVQLTAEKTDLLPHGLYIGWRAPEKGQNSCAVSVNAYDSPKDFWDQWINSDNYPTSVATGKSHFSGTMATDPDTGKPYPKPMTHCGMSSLEDDHGSLVVYLGPEG